MSRIGEKIKDARTQQNMPLKQLAKKCGVAESFLSDIESGKKVINEALIKKLSAVLNVNLEESQYRDEPQDDDMDNVGATRRVAPKTSPLVRTAPSMSTKDIAPEWQSAFSNIIRDIPIYDINMSKAVGHKHLPVIDKKVEGHNPEKLIYISMPDNSLSGFRIKKGDLVMVVLNPEPLNNGLCLMEIDGIKAIKLVKKLDGDRILLLSNPDEIRAETKHIKEIKILGHCLRAEIIL